MSALFLLIFPVCAILWMALNARLGLVRDQPPHYDEDDPAPPAADPVAEADPPEARVTRA
ncbi:hypothetical protein FBT96_18345 [Rhodobacter capsulatus]|uniref:Uncharacterized protein n=1 Tax=Rhodobacter capsulatus TaxID=1061 RepID=A0A4U1JLY5_RHOCA|nr:hypothetical protein [Rhodobacter capsulatus]TKD14414.1 hypothetical protein FBT96_18345 [Rhodobacter capsulatus]